MQVPVLLVYGRSDYITKEADHARIAAVVDAAHLLRAPSQRAAQEAVSAGTARPYDADLSRTIVRWMCAHETCRTGGASVD